MPVRANLEMAIADLELSPPDEGTPDATGPERRWIDGAIRIRLSQISLNNFRKGRSNSAGAVVRRRLD